MNDHGSDRQRWERVKQLVADAARRPAAGRAAFLAAECSGDEAMQREVEALLAAHDQAGDFFDRPRRLLSTLAEVASPRQSAAALAAGQHLGHYEIVEAIGAGGMGEVYRARDTRLHRDVALKILPSTLVEDPVRRKRFIHEARAASAVEHPHIAVIHEIGDAGGITYIAMELVRGEPLARIIARGPLDPRRALDLAAEIAEALARAHEIGLVHRDLKPTNVMLTEDDHVKIIDFGLAKLVRELGGDVTATASSDRTGTGVVLGTPSYMSPEQAQAANVDHRSDIFSFGVMLQEMLTGWRPFRGNSPIDTMHAILHDPPPPLPSSVGAAAGDLQRIVERCLAKTPDDRYQRARDLLVDLRAARRRLESAEIGTSGVSAAPSGRRYVQLAGAGVLVTVAIAALGLWVWTRRAQDENDRKAAVADVERLVDRGRFVDVWRAAQPALRRWPGDAQLEQLLGSTTMTVTIASDPSGADVAFKAYDDITGDWIALGPSPLNGVRAPLGMLRWRVTKSGFEPLEARLEVGTPAAAAGRPDVDAPPLRLRRVGSDVAHMVFVPGGGYGGGRLTDYWLDQTEVTNRDFKGFLDRGAYENPRYWLELRGGAEIAAVQFRDRTGRPGPSTWELGTYPEGHHEHPVNGVSWFEAVAFCRAAGKSLPTVSHWRKAFGETFFMDVVTLGNFGGRGPASVRQLKDVGPWGTYGMSGNVKEWAWNELEGRRYILGGAWNEPVYMATNDDVRPAEDRAETNGFRCVKESAPSDAAAYAAVKGSAPRDYAKEKPVDAATFDIFRRFYSYDRTPLDSRTEQTQEFEEWRRERVSFAAAYGGERVLANLLIPKSAAPPYQAVIWFPGSYATMLKRSDGDLPFSYYFDFLPRSGRALVYPVYKGTYERRSAPAESKGEHGESEHRDLVVQWSKDLGRTIDYLNSRTDFDKDKIAYYGFSMGAAAAIPAVGLERRLKAVILLAGGLNPHSEVLAEAAPINFASKVTAPVLLLAGRHDFNFPVETSQKPLFNLLGTPPADKRHVIFEGAGHVPPRLDIIREVLEWLDRYLGPVDRRTR